MSHQIETEYRAIIDAARTVVNAADSKKYHSHVKHAVVEVAIKKLVKAVDERAATRERAFMEYARNIKSEAQRILNRIG